MIVAGVSSSTAFSEQLAALTRMVNAFPNVDLIHNRLAIVVRVSYSHTSTLSLF